jgi:parallel beta-helix repeat protein
MTTIPLLGDATMIRRTFLLTPFSAVVVLGLCNLADAATLHVPEDYKSIQAAIDAASSGDSVLVVAGTYKERIRVKDGVTLKSAGDDTKGKLGLKRAEATIIDGGGELGKGAGVTMAQGATIDGFTVTNVGLYDDDEWKKHHATQGEHQSHEHIGEPGTPGIGAIGVTCTIRNNIVHHIGYTGIAIQGVKGERCSPHIDRNICYRNMGGGIGSMRKSTAVIEENICFQNFYAGIGHDDASPSVINNVCYENIRAGIGISEGSRPIVRGNKCYKNRRAGIGTRTGANTRPIIEDNECYENDMAGIGTREEASPIIRNNRCYKNKLAGIGSRTHATPTIIGNECYENGKTGIGQQGDAVTLLIGNHCHHNKAAGIGFAACKAGRSTVLNNRIIDNALVAIGINSGWTVRLSDNELSRKGGLPPIVMVFDGADATFTKNVIRGGGVAGIRVAGKIRAEDNEFAGTSLRRVGPPNFAIWALPGSDVTMRGNKIHGWRHGLHATEAGVSATNNTVSNFHSAAFVIQKSSSPADVYGNTAISKNSKDRVLSLSGKTGVVKNNELGKPVP